MGEVVLAGNPPMRVRIHRRANARRMTLRVSAISDIPTVTVPLRTPRQQIEDFLDKKREWLQRQLSRVLSPRVVTFGRHLPVRGKLRVVARDSCGKPRLADDTLYLPAHDNPGRAVALFLRRLAQQELKARCDGFAAKICCNYTALALRDTRSRWGSCNAAGRLMFSWRLIMAPPDILGYVAAHEVAHLIEMNHSAAFWRQVEHLFGPFASQRQWLKTHGNELLCWDFGTQHRQQR